MHMWMNTPKAYLVPFILDDCSLGKKEKERILQGCAVTHMLLNLKDSLYNYQASKPAALYKQTNFALQVLVLFSYISTGL